MTKEAKGSLHLDNESAIKRIKAFAESFKSMDKIVEALKINKEITEADNQSTTQLMDMYQITLDAINKEIEATDDIERKRELEKQRKDILEHAESEKSGQREYNNHREERTHSSQRWILGVSATLILTGTGVGAKYFLYKKEK